MECCIERKVFRQLQTRQCNASTRTPLVTTVIKFNNTQNSSALSQLPKVTALCMDNNCRTRHNRAIRIYRPMNSAHWPMAGKSTHTKYSMDDTHYTSVLSTSHKGMNSILFCRHLVIYVYIFIMHDTVKGFRLQNIPPN